MSVFARAFPQGVGSLLDENWLALLPEKWLVVFLENAGRMIFVGMSGF